MRCAASTTLCLALAIATAARADTRVPAEPAIQSTLRAASPADAIVTALPDAQVRLLVREVLERNPALAGLAATAHAAEQRAPQVRSLPDPVLMVTAFLMAPETRVGPQRAALGLSQKLPWFGTLKLREQVALYGASVARARVEAKRLQLVTETRRLAYELAFLDGYEQVLREDHAALGHYEELARARYASGVGFEQNVVKIQAEITRDDSRLLELATRRAELEASVNALRDQPDSTPMPHLGLPAYPRLEPKLPQLREQALGARPELAATVAEIELAKVEVELARKAYRPDLTLGLAYTVVGDRTDAAGRAAPPEGNGRDILALTGAVNLPVHRDKLAAGVEEAGQRQLAAEESNRSQLAAIEQSLGDLASRIPLTSDRIHLLADVLNVQARQSLQSAEAGYSTGTLAALDLLDAERVLLDVRIATERARADYAIAVARLEGAVGAPLAGAASPSSEETHE